MDWGMLASYASAFAAIVALFISGRQIRLSNKQSLFSRRLEIWVITEKLMELYGDYAHLLKQTDEPQLAIGLNFAWLTNTSFLQEITPCISHAGEAEYQLKLHLKLDELKTLSIEAGFIFKGESGRAIEEFLDAYRVLLLEMYCYQGVINAMKKNAGLFGHDLDKTAGGHNEMQYRKRLYEIEDALSTVYGELSCEKLVSKIRYQIRLDKVLRG